MRHFPNQCFICKPSRGRGGEGISLIKKFHDLPRNANHNEYLVQRYVENPLLVQSKKFDIRLYIVIKGVDPIEAYLFDEGLARFCTVSLFPNYFYPGYLNLRIIIRLFYIRPETLFFKLTREFLTFDTPRCRSCLSFIFFSKTTRNRTV